MIPTTQPKGTQFTGQVLPPSPTSSDVVTDDGKVVHRMFKDSKQAHAAYRGLRRDNAQRNRRNAEIQRKLNNEPPYKPKTLEAQGQTWRSNRPTGFMSGLIARVKPGYKKTILDSQSLTFSSHPAEGPEAEQKTSTFREEVTKLFRGWDGFDDFLSSVIHENVTFGYTAATWESEYDWRPTWLRQDEVFFQAESSKDVDRQGLWARIRRYGIHELVPIIENPLSPDAGYNIENLIEAVNNAVPPTKFDGDGSDNARKYEDYVREGSLGASYEQEGKFVTLGQVLVKEPTGKVSVYVFTEKDGKEILTVLDAYDTMEDAIALWSVEDGTGPLMTSRGAGRDLYNTHVAVERARNLVWDNLYLAGLLILKKGDGAMPGTVPLTVMHPVAYVGKGYEVQEAAVTPNVEAFFQLDRHATAIAEMQLGVFLPGQSNDSQGESRTASEVNYVAAVDAQIREGILSRFYFQFLRCVNQVQRRICHPEHLRAAMTVMATLQGVSQQLSGVAVEWADRDVVSAFRSVGLDLPPGLFEVNVDAHLDEAAVRCCVKMLQRGLSVSDVILISRSPAHNLAQDASAMVNQGIQQVAMAYKGDPNVDQLELTRRDIASRVGNDVADALVIGQDDQTVQAEAVREQTHEINDMMNGLDVPVSPRDPDEIHLETIGEKFAPVLQSGAQVGVQQLVPAFMRVVQHFDAHVQQMKAKGGDPGRVQQYEQASAQMHQLLDHYAQTAQAGPVAEPPPGQAPAAAVSQDGPPAPPALPPPPPGAPVEAAANPLRPTPPRPEEVAAKAQTNPA